MTATERFLRYVKVYTTSDENAETSPSSQRQRELGRMLQEELTALGLADVRMDEAGNVLATLCATEENVPVLALIAHMDTSPDAPGEGVVPRVVLYTGGDLPLGGGVTLELRRSPELADWVGEELIVTDGSTLLGADDKAGVAEIMTALEKLRDGDAPHGEIRVVFTTDEEIGRGVEGLDVKALGCAYGYTVDGGALGEIEYENFNAASAVVTIHGVGVHPGSAKGVMVNAATVAMAFHAMLPREAVPEKTDGYEGFFHLHQMRGDMTEAVLSYLVRDHDSAAFEEKKALLHHCADAINRYYGAGTAELTITDTYYNMKEQILPHKHLIRRAEEAFRAAGIAPRCVAIRGGTDGARLSWDGLPCPNLSTGGYNFHSVREWIPVRSLERMPEVLLHLCCSFAQRGED